MTQRIIFYGSHTTTTVNSYGLTTASHACSGLSHLGTINKNRDIRIWLEGEGMVRGLWTEPVWRAILVLGPAAWAWASSNGRRLFKIKCRLRF